VSRDKLSPSTDRSVPSPDRRRPSLTNSLCHVTEPFCQLTKPLRQAKILSPLATQKPSGKAQLFPLGEVVACRTMSQVDALISKKRNMGILSKVEILLGIAFSISIILYMWFVDYPLARWIAEEYQIANWSYWRRPTFIVLSVWLLAVPICAYLHAARTSYIAFGILLIVGGLIAFLTLLDVLLGHAFEGHPWIGVAPGFIAFSTIIVSIINLITYPRTVSLKLKP
jgi:hypothetical protein